MKRILLAFIFITMVHHITMAQCNGYTTLGNGHSHSLALRADGTLWAWGDNSYGKLGDGTTVNKTIPTQIGTGTDTWKAIAGAAHFSIAIKSDGTLWAWGNNSYSQLGDGTTVSKNTPTLIDGGSWRAISPGSQHCFAIKADSTLWAWGQNSFDGILGVGTSANKTTPTQIGTDNTWKVVIAGNSRSFGIKSNGTLWGWGSWYTSTPTQIGTDTWKTIAQSNSSVVGIKSDGTLWSWGSNFSGILGLGEASSSYESYVPRQIGADSWKAVACGENHCLAIKSDGTLWGWGYNNDYRLGYETSFNNQHAPVQIGTAQWKAIHIGLGSAHNLGIQQDGSLWAWGNNYYGQAGNGTSFNGLTSPTLIHTPVYSNSLAASSSSHTITGNPMYAIFSSGCNPIAAVQQPADTYNGVTGAVTAKVWVEPTAPANYVKRHYEITPAADMTTASAWVTLYFTQEEFDEFNNVNTTKLPTNATDNAGKANLLIEKRDGESTNNTGLPDTYTGDIETINPNDADIVWNAAASRWEVTFEVTGFSGFFVKTQADVLPVTFGDISAIVRGGTLFVNFTSLAEENNDRFIIEASADGKDFTAIGTLKSTAKEGNSDIAIQYSFSLNANSLGIASMVGFGLFALLCFAARRNRGIFAVAALICAASFISCNRNVEELNVNSGENVYIRIAQVDKDGTKTYSKVVKAVKE